MENLPRFTDLTLILTEQCNLDCSFCYVPRTGRVMSREVALGAVDLLVDRAPAGAALSISFFGGEPFLARELMQEVITYARERRPGGLSFSTPTNGTLFDAEAEALVRSCDMSIALSVDTLDEDREGDHAWTRLGERGPRLAALASIARMTVTSKSVDRMFSSITGMFAEGLRTIMHQPALEAPWPEAAIDSWRDQHIRLGDWACERYEQGLPLPELVVLEGIVSRLEGRAAASYCGAGVKLAAVDPAGRIFGCYRSAYDPRADDLVMGHVLGGPVNEPLTAAYGRLHPNRARPEDRGSCKGCEAREGCTVYCAATGHAVTGDLRGVSSDGCTLMRIQVDSCRDTLRRMRRIDRRRRPRKGSRVAAAALALSLAGGAAACDDRTAEPSSDGPVGGVCPSQLDARVDGPAADHMIGGVCAVKPDGLFMDAPQKLDGKIIPGQCPFKPDGPVGGVCPIAPDAKAPKLDIKIGPGMCPFKPDGMTPGLC